MLSRVWEHSRLGGTELLMLLAIADFADDDGRAYPAVPTLARKCRLQKRRANYILSALKASGELEVHDNAGPRGTNRYRITLPLHPSAPVQRTAPLHPSARTPALECPTPLHPSAYEPSLNRHEPSERARKRATSTPKSKRATRLATDWKIPDAYRAFCAEARPDLNPDAVAADFHDYWLSAADGKGAKLDWLATWRRWVRNQRALYTAGNVAQRRSPLHADEVFGVPT